jgi:hypothetical protein
MGSTVSVIQYQCKLQQQQQEQQQQQQQEQGQQELCNSRCNHSSNYYNNTLKHTTTTTPLMNSIITTFTFHDLCHDRDDGIKVHDEIEEELSATSDEYIQTTISIPNSPASASGSWAMKCINISKMCENEEETYDYKQNDVQQQQQQQRKQMDETMLLAQKEKQKIKQSLESNLNQESSIFIKSPLSSNSKLWNRRQRIS